MKERKCGCVCAAKAPDSVSRFWRETRNGPNTQLDRFLETRGPSLPNQNVAEIRQRCTLRRINFNEQHRTRQEGYFDFGPRWKNLQCLHLGEREALAELQLGQEFLWM